MANISRDTFNKMKHYVSVRLQQGVPLVDADWNEMEDIRRFELQAFLKWFIGDGVPVGNDGFRIVGIDGQIVLTSKKIEIEIDLNLSTAAETLGFYSTNCRAARWAPPSAQLLGKNPGPFSGLVAKTLVIKTHNPRESEWSTDTVEFQQSDFHDSNQASAAEVVAAINRASHLKATVGEQNDFTIQGGDGASEGAGRCLVEGWDVINESNLNYSHQRLYENEALANKWNVDLLPKLADPQDNRTDLVYLDVWEREVDQHEDAELENPKIGVPTCVRIKREWVVRVLENCHDQRQVPKDIRKEGHAYYPLAWKTGQEIVDLRRTGLTLSNLCPGWVLLPFLPKPGVAFQNSKHPFSLGIYNATCGQDGAQGSMEIPIPPGCKRINCFRIAGKRNDDNITVTLHRVNFLVDDVTATPILEMEIKSKGENKPFNEILDSASFKYTNLDPKESALAVQVEASNIADIWSIGVEFMAE